MIKLTYENAVKSFYIFFYGFFAAISISAGVMAMFHGVILFGIVFILAGVGSVFVGHQVWINWDDWLKIKKE